MGTGVLGPEVPRLPSGTSGSTKGAKGVAGLFAGRGTTRGAFGYETPRPVPVVSAFLAALFVWLNEY